MKIGITGGIGVGKSTLSNILIEKGYKVFVADNIAKDLLKSDEKLRQEIISAFGEESYLENDLNVNYLAEKVFINQENVRKINSIVHPKTIKTIEKLMNEENEKSNLVFCESALIYEAGMEDLFDYIVTVKAEESTKIERIKKRDNISSDEIYRRMKNQYSEQFKIENADFTIDNNGSVEDLVPKVDFLLNLFKTLSKH